jgi:hypothetical protein
LTIIFRNKYYKCKLDSNTKLYIVLNEIWFTWSAWIIIILLFYQRYSTFNYNFIYKIFKYKYSIQIFQIFFDFTLVKIKNTIFMSKIRINLGSLCNLFIWLVYTSGPFYQYSIFRVIIALVPIFLPLHLKFLTHSLIQEY